MNNLLANRSDNSTFFTEVDFNNLADYEDNYFLQNLQNDESRARWNIKLFFCIGYGVLFFLGILGNGFVITMIGNVMFTIAKNKNGLPSRRVNASSTMHVFIYVLGLSIVDFFVILHLPFLIIEMLKGEWIFGQIMCKLYWYGESVNKLLSSLLMTVLSWDRYLAVCSPLSSFRMRTNSVALTVVVSFYFLATLLLYPVLRESNVFQVNKLTGIRLSDNSVELIESDRLGLTISKCVFDYGMNTTVFMVYTFAVGYLLPALLIIFFYLKVILRLRENALSVRKHSDQQNIQLSNNMFRKVMKRIIAVILFYFFCWTPYWILNIMAQFGFIVVSWSTLTLSSVFFSAHLLVCFNSAANPVLYALINRELRQQHVEALQRRRQSLHNVTACAIELMEKRTQRFSSASTCISQLKTAPFTAVTDSGALRTSNDSIDFKSYSYLYGLHPGSSPSVCCPLLIIKNQNTCFSTAKLDNKRCWNNRISLSNGLHSYPSFQRRMSSSVAVTSSFENKPRLNYLTPLHLTSPIRRSASSNDLLLSSLSSSHDRPETVCIDVKKSFDTSKTSDKVPPKKNKLSSYFLKKNNVDT